MTVITSDAAKDDIKKNYISFDNPIAANNMVKKILECITSLANTYNSGANLNIKRKTQYRFKIVKPYLVFYELGKDFVSVIRVLHGSTNYLKILGI